MARLYPLACAGAIMAGLSTAGFPLLAGFPPRLALWEGLAGESLWLALWLLVGVAGLMFATIRSLAVVSMAPEQTGWAWNETGLQAALLGIGLAGLLFLGVFPQVVRPFLANLPLLFSHLTQ
jgi:NADH:ubiquinone oxidoreductase subunit 2 (subunit N)